MEGRNVFVFRSSGHQPFSDITVHIPEKSRRSFQIFKELEVGMGTNLFSKKAEADWPRLLRSIFVQTVP